MLRQSVMNLEMQCKYYVSKMNVTKYLKLVIGSARYVRLV